MAQMTSNTRLEYILLLLVSLAAAVWFFMDYASQDPRSSIDITLSKQQVEAQARSKLKELGYAITKFKVDRAAIVPDEELLDSLQKHRGRAQITSFLADSTAPNLKPFVWQVSFRNKENPHSLIQIRSGSDASEVDQQLNVQMDPAGHLTALQNENEVLPEKIVNRAALGNVFSSADSSSRPVMSAVSDSMLSRMLYFDIQGEPASEAHHQRADEQHVLDQFSRGIPYLQSKNDAQALTDYYLSKTSWDRRAFTRDTIFIKRVGTVNAANVRYQTRQVAQGQHLQLDVVVAPTGALLGLQPTYNQQPASAISQNSLWDIVQVMLEFIFLIVVFVVFFFRMRARSIDTISALMVAIVMGLIMLVTLFLGAGSNLNLFSANVNWSQLLALLFGFSLVAAFIAVTSFVIFAVSDSLSRQYWSEKIASFDYLLQGSVFSKPVGRVLLRSVGLAFILAGAWTMLLHLFPGLYLQVEHIFLSDNAVWPPLNLVLNNIWYSFSLMFSIFLIIGSQAFGWSHNRWAAGGLMVLACAVAVHVTGGYGPPFHSFLLSGCLGVLLTGIYLKWDFLTAIMSYFLFLGLIGSVTGWMIPGSPDLYVFIAVILVITLVGLMGAVTAVWGQEEHALTEYVPGYIQELAQEQRIKQELQIAREVQQSFLPSHTPAMIGLDVAATCQPAHETGGDYYDFIPLDDHSLAVAIGDVSGKGIQAAFYMTLVKGMLHSLCHETDSPAEVLSKANQLFFDNATKGTFISLIYGIIDLKKKTFVFARAGHNPILRINISSGEVEELQPGGLGLGLTKEKIFDNKIQEIELSLTEDDLFLLYTDGIVEALNRRHEFFGSDKLESLIREKRHESAASIVAAVSERVTQFMADSKQHDDMTLLAIRFNEATS